MGGEDELAQGSSTALDAIQVDDLTYLREVVSGLPPKPTKDLLAAGVCVRCTFRLLCLPETCSYPFFSTRVLRDTLYDFTGMDGSGLNRNPRSRTDLPEIECAQDQEEFKVCKVCIGILQYAYRDDKRETLVEKNCATDFSAAISHYVKQEGHQFDSFSLEVSLPQLVVQNEQAVRLFIKNKYNSESWFLDKPAIETTGAKDFLKKSLTAPLEHLLGVRSSESSFRIHLLYSISNASAGKQQMTDNNGCFKKRKIDRDPLRKCDVMVKNGHELPKSSLVVSENDGITMQGFPLDEVQECCSLTFNCYRTPVFVGGRYLKYSRNVSQTRWIIDDERMGEASIEEIVGGSILPIFQADNYKFHAAGREDIDVRMLGTGRPFLVEIQNARKLPSSLLLKEIELKINSLENKLVRVKNLEILNNQGWELMREGEA